MAHETPGDPRAGALPSPVCTGRAGRPAGRIVDVMNPMHPTVARQTSATTPAIDAGEASRLALTGRATDLEHLARALACDGLVVLAELVEVLPDTGEASRSDTVDGSTVEADLPDGGDLDAVA